MRRQPRHRRPTAPTRRRWAGLAATVAIAGAAGSALGAIGLARVLAAPAAAGASLTGPAGLALLVAGTAAACGLAGLVYSLGFGRDDARHLAGRRAAEMAQTALHDPLTGLPARTLVLDRIGQLLVRTRRSLTAPALLLVDLDDFGRHNDTLGRRGGDELLRAVATRLSGAVRQGDTVGRLGDDEFVVVAECSLAEEGADALVGRITRALGAPFELGCTREAVTATASIGVAVGDRAMPEQLLHDADVALSQAKAAGTQRSASFRAADRTPPPARRLLEADLRRALGRRELSVVYQPVVALPGGRLVGVEAQLCWRHPEHGVLAGADVLPHLEATGLVGSVGSWLLREACGQGARWAALGHPLEVTVRLSPRQLEAEGLVDAVAAALARSGHAHHRLVVELAESSLLEVPNATSSLLGRLRALGVRIAVGEFGAGYTSFAHLRQFPVDIVRVDPSVVRGAARSREAAALLHRLVQLGRRLELETVATGVDGDAERALAEAEGIDAAQGQHVGPPVAAGDLEARLAPEPAAGPPAAAVTAVPWPRLGEGG